MKLDMEKIKEQFKFDGLDDQTARYGWATEDSNVTMCQVRICHAGINSPPVDEHPYVAVVTQIMGNHKGTHNTQGREAVGEETVKKYYDWLFNRSPLSDLFITKDVEEALGSKLILIGTKHFRAAVMTACIMTRYIWEETKVLYPWVDLVEAGVPEDVAFILAHTVSCGYNERPELLDVRMTSTNCNHNILSGNLVKGLLTNFINGKMNSRETQTYYENMVKDTKPGVAMDYGWCGVGTLFHRNNGNYSFVSTIRRVVKKALGGKAPAKTVSTNPFSMDLDGVAADLGPYDEVIGAMAKCWKQVLEEDVK